MKTVARSTSASPLPWLVALATLVSVNVGIVPGAVSASTPRFELWVSRFDGAGNGPDYASALGVSPDGSKVYVTGSSLGTSSDYWTDYATVAYEVSSGAELWRSTYDGPETGGDSADALAVSPDGSVVFVTGGSDASDDGGNEDYLTVAYDATSGAELWVSRYDGPVRSQDEADAIEVSPDGSWVFVTGSSLGSTDNPLDYDYDYATVAYDASTGSRLWTRRYDGPMHMSDNARAVATSPDGSQVFVTGASVGSSRGRNDFATMAYDAYSGARLWTKRYNGPGSRSDSATALAVSPDGSHVYVTGENSGATSNHDYATLAYDADSGAREWTRQYNGPGHSYDGAIDVGSSPDGSSVFVTGQSIGRAGDYDYATVAYDASTGARLWVSRYDGPGAGMSIDTASGLIVSPDGSQVFVTGRSTGPSRHYHYATVGYDASSGDRLLRQRYNGPGHSDDGANDLGMSPDGRELFVTGYSAGSTSGEDYATLAYGPV